MTNTRSTLSACGGAASVASALSSDPASKTPSGRASDFAAAAPFPLPPLFSAPAAADRDNTTFSRPGSGRALAGRDSHVARPMTTALRRGSEDEEEGGEGADDDDDGPAPSPAASTVDVTALKCAMSPARRQGRPPPRPMPQARPAATTSWKERRPGSGPPILGRLTDGGEILNETERGI